MTALLSTIIAMIGIFTVFALGASWVNEQIATFLNLRSKTLVAGVQAMIGDAATNDFFQHALIASLGERRSPWPAKLGDITGMKYARVKLGTTPVQPTGVAQATPTVSLPPYISAEHYATVVLDLLKKQAPGASGLASVATGATDVVAALNTLSTNAAYKPLYDALLPIWRDAQGDYQAFSTTIASWYDSHMDRVSGWYKRSVQIILLYIGLIIAVAFNVDTIDILHELQSNATLATGLASATEQYAAQHSTAAANGTAAAVPVELTDHCDTSSGSCVCKAGFTASPAGAPTQCVFDANLLGQLPIGWTASRFRSLFSNDWPIHVFYKCVGLSITTIAILLGAPFWFDLLGAIVNVRSVGVKPDPASSVAAS